MDLLEQQKIEKKYKQDEKKQNQQENLQVKTDENNSEYNLNNQTIQENEYQVIKSNNDSPKLLYSDRSTNIQSSHLSTPNHPPQKINKIQFEQDNQNVGIQELEYINLDPQLQNEQRLSNQNLSIQNKLIDKNEQKRGRKTFSAQQKLEKMAINQQNMNLQQNQLNKKQGRWTKEEHLRFLEALKLYGKEWRKVQQHVITRTSTQARSHAQKFFVKLEKKNLQLDQYLEMIDLSNLAKDCVFSDLEDDSNSDNYNNNQIEKELKPSENHLTLQISKSFNEYQIKSPQKQKNFQQNKFQSLQVSKQETLLADNMDDQSSKTEKLSEEIQVQTQIQISLSQQNSFQITQTEQRKQKMRNSKLNHSILQKRYREDQNLNDQPQDNNQLETNQNNADVQEVKENNKRRIVEKDYKQQYNNQQLTLTRQQTIPLTPNLKSVNFYNSLADDNNFNVKRSNSLFEQDFLSVNLLEEGFNLNQFMDNKNVLDDDPCQIIQECQYFEQAQQMYNPYQIRNSFDFVELDPKQLLEMTSDNFSTYVSQNPLYFHNNINSQICNCMNTVYCSNYNYMQQQQYLSQIQQNSNLSYQKPQVPTFFGKK